MKEKTIEIKNCLVSKQVNTNISDESPDGDNNYHCPITGNWVELIRSGSYFKCNIPEQIICLHEDNEDLDY